MSSEDVAIALVPQDGGNVVRRLYGHRDRRLALDRIVSAYETRSPSYRLKEEQPRRSAGQERLF
jgi:hypothetical protein